ncbi:hypothetical protein BD770DRAFT_394288 [Pilaira anomala]|nr:hypothetical protein BD770DRAFT_394288 [Pilaira anomala]
MISQLLQYVFLIALGSIHLVNAEWLSAIPGTPERSINKVFGIPTWMAHIKDYDEDAMNATTVFSVVCIALSTFYVLYFIFFVHFPSLPRNQRHLGPFNTLILSYLISTLFASFTFSIMNVGRIWASFGVFHNLFEIALLSNLMLRQKSVIERSFVLKCFIYVLVTMIITILVPWPLDALFFKFQGLATDFALAIDMGRLYYHNKAIHNKASVGMMFISSDEGEVDESDEFNSECDEVVHKLKKRMFEEREQVMDDPNKSLSAVRIPVHKNILVMFIASSLHAFGNAIVTFSNHFIYWIIFQFIYAIAFPMYAYYCIVEPNTSRLSFYKASRLKETLVVLSSIGFAGTSIAIGAYNVLSK